MASARSWQRLLGPSAAWSVLRRRWAGPAFAPLVSLTSAGLAWQAGPAALKRCAACQTKEEKSLWVAGGDDGGADRLACTYDTFGGAIVDPKISLPAPEFRRRLAASLAKWRADGRQGVWLEVRAEDAALIPIATLEYGFKFHSAEETHVTLKAWLPTDRPSTLPGNATHTVGVGAIVVDQETNRVLLVQEKSGPAAKLGIWKLPTGTVDAGEELGEAAKREVLEETGVDAEFVDLRAFRMSHRGNLAHKGKSNIFFIARFNAKPGAAKRPLKPQASEIAEARWFSMEEYDAQAWPPKGTMFHLLNRSALESEACIKPTLVDLGMAHNRQEWMYTPVPIDR